MLYTWSLLAWFEEVEWKMTLHQKRQIINWPTLAYSTFTPIVLATFEGMLPGPSLFD